MKPPVDAPTSRQTRPARSIAERVERGRELVAPAADVRLRRRDLDRRRGIDEVAGLAVEAGAVALPHPDLAGEHERLGAAARLDQPAIDEQLVEPDRAVAFDDWRRDSPAYRGTARCTRAHRRGAA